MEVSGESHASEALSLWERATSTIFVLGGWVDVAGLDVLEVR
jgi:hypothetical protein